MEREKVEQYLNGVCEDGLFSAKEEEYGAKYKDQRSFPGAVSGLYRQYQLHKRDEDEAQ